MGFGILTVDTLIVVNHIKSPEEDILRDTLKLPSAFTLAHGPLQGPHPHSANWILRSDLIPSLPDEPCLPVVQPVYSRRTAADGTQSTTLDRVEIHSGKDYRMLAALACAVPLPDDLAAYAVA